jgi:hypothetical protein
MSREASTTTSLATGINAIIGNFSKDSFVTSGQMMSDVKFTEFVLCQFLDQLTVKPEKMLSCEVKSIRICQQRTEFEHVCLVIKQLSLKLGTLL